MKNLLSLVCVLALLVLARPATAQDCPVCVKTKVRVALALAKAQVVAEATAKPAPTAPALEPVRVYRIGSLPPYWVAPAPVVYPAPLHCTPGQ